MLNVRLTLDYHVQRLWKKRWTITAYQERGSEDVYYDIFAMQAGLISTRKPSKLPDSDGNELFNKAVAAYNLGPFSRLSMWLFFLKPGYVGWNHEEAVAGDGFYNTPVSPGNIYHIVYTHMDRMISTIGWQYYCEGAVNVNGLIFRCHSYFEGGHGYLDMEKAFAVSCNSYFINLSLKTGYRKLIEMARKFGLGEVTGIAGQGIAEAPGSLPPVDSYYSQADIANLSIGQGALLATPLQVADMVATVANGGIRNRVNIAD